LQPDYPAALGRLAFLEARSGAWQRAIDLGEQALNKNPDDVKAHLALALAETELDRLNRAEQRLMTLVAMEQLGPNDRYLALGTLGDVRDRQNRLDEAVALYNEANAVRRTANGPSASRMLGAVVSLRRYIEAASFPPIPHSAPLPARWPSG